MGHVDQTAFGQPQPLVLVQEAACRCAIHQQHSPEGLAQIACADDHR